MSRLNAILRAVCDALLSPFSRLPPWIGLSVVSLVTSVLVLLAFKTASNQARIALVKRQIAACLFEIRLYRDDAWAIVRAQGEILGATLTYMRLSLVPMLWLAIPLFLVVAQLQFHYGYRGLTPGERFNLIVRLKQAGARPGATLVAPEGLTVETPAVYLPSLRELDFRLRAGAPGQYELALRLGDEVVEKSVDVGGGIRRRSPERVAPRFFDQLFHPAEAPLPAASAVESVSVRYAEGTVSLWLFHAHWLVAFFILSAIFTLILRGPLKITL